MNSPNFQNSVKSVIERLAYRFKIASETPVLEAQVLAAHVMRRSRTWVTAHPEADLSIEQAAELEQLVRRRENGEPLPYLLGRWEFYGLELEVSADALIPRAETELLVDAALEWLRRRPGRSLAADVGTGSGCISAAIAAHHAEVYFVASDISLAALRLAKRNIARHGLSDRAACVQADLLPPCGRRFDLICANLPYIPSETLAGLAVSRWEPAAALDGGPDGLNLIRRLAAQAQNALEPGGLLLLEIEAGQGPMALTLAQFYFPGADVCVVRDLAGRDRLVRVMRIS